MKNLILALTLSLFIFNISGQNHIELVCGTGQAGLLTPHGIAIDKNQNIYIADMGTHQILEIDMEKRVKSIAGTGKPGSGLSELNKPAAVLVHAGHIWVADLNNHQIKIIPLH